jgi:hypothetical protein
MEDTIKKTVQLELEVDTVAKGPNKYQGLVDLAKAIDAWRIFPRVFICTYIYLLYKVTIWFMALPDPNNAQAGLVSVVVGAGAAWFGLYTGTGPKMQKSESVPMKKNIG